MYLRQKLVDSPVVLLAGNMLGAHRSKNFASIYAKM
jgi:hypothetical protein